MADEKPLTTRKQIGDLAANATWTPVEYESAWNALSEHERAFLGLLWNTANGSAADADCADVQRDWPYAVRNTVAHRLQKLQLIRRIDVDNEDGTKAKGWVLERSARDLMAWQTNRNLTESKVASVARRDRLRLLLLRRIYDHLGPTGHGAVKDLAVATAKEVGGEEADAEEALRYLSQRDYFANTTMGWNVGLSSQAVDVVEDIMRKESGRRDAEPRTSDRSGASKGPSGAPIKKGEKPVGEWVRAERLGGGGQGDAFMAYHKDDPRRSKPHVLKQLRNPARLARFEKEVNAALRLDHTNIVKVVDYDLKAPKPYLVTPYYSRGHLTIEHVRRLLPAEKLLFFAKICRALGHAHEKGVTHRDLKPENILLAEDGEPVVADFGICYISDDQRATETLEAVGSRFCTPPELEDGRAEEVTPASDAYCLGKLLYWLFAGRSFQREKHRDPDLDLTKKAPAEAHAFVYELLDGMIVDRSVEEIAGRNRRGRGCGTSGQDACEGGALPGPGLAAGVRLLPVWPLPGPCRSPLVEVAW